MVMKRDQRWNILQTTAERDLNSFPGATNENVKLNIAIGEQGE